MVWLVILKSLVVTVAALLVLGCILAAIAGFSMWRFTRHGGGRS